MARRWDIQELQYEFPYHYLPSYDGQRFVQHRHWSWGYRYLGRLQLVLDALDEIDFESLIDIGCGDGRLLAEAGRRWPQRSLLGIDTSEKAIALARQMNPGLDLRSLDIVDAQLDREYDVATLLEVIEHVPPAELDGFLAAALAALRPGGYLILTVPHRNERMIDKHYQHFTADSLQALIGERCASVRCVPFDRRSLVSSLVWKLLGGSGRYYVVTHTGINSRLFQRYVRRQLRASGERGCRRLLCVAQKPAAAAVAP